MALSAKVRICSGGGGAASSVVAPRSSANDNVETALIGCPCARIDTHPANGLKNFVMHLPRFLKNRLMVSHTIAKTADGVEPIMHGGARLRTLSPKSAMETRTPQCRIIGTRHQTDPEGKFHFGDNRAGMPNATSVCGFLDSASGMRLERRGGIEQPSVAVGARHRLVQGVSQTNLKALQRRVKRLGKPGVALIKAESRIEVSICGFQIFFEPVPR